MQSFLVVDNRDGRVLGEIDDPLEALRALDEFEQHHPELAGAFCLVKFGGHPGALIGTETTTRVRSLT